MFKKHSLSTMVVIHVADRSGLYLKVKTGTELKIKGSILKGAPERLRVPDHLREGTKDPVDLPATWDDWKSANPAYPLAQIREVDSKHRRYIYIPNRVDLKSVSGTCEEGESLVVCAARELWEETGLDLRSDHSRFSPTQNSNFNVTVTDAEKSVIETTLNGRIGRREGEIFGFRWDRSAGGARRRTRRQNGRRHRKTKRRI